MPPPMTLRCVPMASIGATMVTLKTVAIPIADQQGNVDRQFKIDVFPQPGLRIHRILGKS
jgi:hypothetical protein